MAAALGATAQDKPRWAIKGTDDINRQRSNDTYRVVKFERFGPSLSIVREQSDKCLAEYFAKQFGLNADDATTVMKDELKHYFEYKGTLANQEEGDLTVLADFEVTFPDGDTAKTFNARLIDEYVSFDENVDGTFDYTLYQLYAVATREGVVPRYDDVSYNRDYRGRAFIRSIIPGMGQLYKGQKTKAYCIWGGEIAFAALAIYADHRKRQYWDDYQNASPEIAPSYRSKSKSWRTVRDLSAAAAVGIYAYNLIDAALSKGPRKVTLSPAKPDKATLSFGPTVVYDPSSICAPALGFTLTF